LKEIFDELDLEIADALCRDLCIDDAIRPAAEIDGGGGQSFVHGMRKYPARKMPRFDRPFLHGFAKSNAHIFDGVMLIHVEITAGVHVQIKCAMTRERVPACGRRSERPCDAGFSAAIETQLQADVGLIRFR